MKRVLIYGGTTEGRRLAEKLAEAGIPSLVLVATEYGEQMMEPGEKSGRIQVLQGRLTAAEMTALYQREQPVVIVDATELSLPIHPLMSDEDVACVSNAIHRFFVSEI